MGSDGTIDDGSKSMRERVGGQSAIAFLQEVRAEYGPRSRRDRFLARHIFRNRRGYGVFWQAMAQKRVADLLSELGPEWAVLHDLPVRGATALIDHLVVGPGGAFAVETLPVYGQNIWVGGRTLRAGKTDVMILPLAEELAILASEALSGVSGLQVRCEAVLVLMNAGAVSVPISPLAVKLTTEESIFGWLRDRPVCLDTESVAAIRRAAELPRTWADEEIPVIAPGAVLDGYSSILLDIENRQKVSGRWKVARRVGGWVIFVGAAAAAIPLMLALMPG